MAKIVEDAVVIKFSKIVKNNENDSLVIASEKIIQELEQLVQELVGDSIIVEIMGD